MGRKGDCGLGGEADGTQKQFELALRVCQIAGTAPESGMTLGIPGAGAYLNRLSALTL